MRLASVEVSESSSARTDSYQPEHHETKSVPCQYMAQSSEKSTSQAACLCTGALRKIGDGSDSFPFECFCSDGDYLEDFANPKSCKKCPYCKKGEWLSGCEKNTSGVCSPCQTCGDGEILVGCHRRKEGTCEKKNTKDAKCLVREPVCIY
jgi:hypothetical protein